MPATNNIDIFAVLKTPLQAYADSARGVLSIASDPFEIIELLAEAPGRFRVILGWSGEQVVGDHRSGIVKHSFRVIVSQNRGLPMLKGSQLSVPRADGPKTLMERANEVRDLIRALDLAETQTSHLFEYAGCEPTRVDMEGKTYLLDAYELTFRMIAALPKITR